MLQGSNDVSAPHEPSYNLTIQEGAADAPSAPSAASVPYSEITLPMAAGQANLDMPILEVWAMVDEMSRHINEYYDHFSQTVAFLSKNGYLFDSPAGAYVFPRELYGFFDIDERFLDENIMFFYLRPIDLYGFRNISVSERDELVIFTGFETREGFAITGRGEQGGMISREDLSGILDKYSWNHGPISRVDAQSDVFEASMRALAAYTGNNTGFDIRYMYRDERYICLVVSPRHSPLDISMFILEYHGDAVSVQLSNIESFDNHVSAVNNALPGFNHDLLPPYDLGALIGNLTDDFDDLIEAMLYEELISEDHLPPIFISGTSEFVFAEFDSQLIFLAHIESGNWTIEQVSDYTMAAELLSDLSRRPPLFIIRQN